VQQPNDDSYFVSCASLQVQGLQNDSREAQRQLQQQAAQLEQLTAKLVAAESTMVMLAMPTGHAQHIHDTEVVPGAAASCRPVQQWADNLQQMKAQELQHHDSDIYKTGGAQQRMEQQAGRELERMGGAAPGSMPALPDAQPVENFENVGLLKQQLAELQDWVVLLTSALAEWDQALTDCSEVNKMSSDGNGRSSGAAALPDKEDCVAADTCNAALSVLAGQQCSPDSSAAGQGGEPVCAASAEPLRQLGCYRQLLYELQSLTGRLQQVMEDRQMMKATLAWQQAELSRMQSSLVAERNPRHATQDKKQLDAEDEAERERQAHAAAAVAAAELAALLDQLAAAQHEAAKVGELQQQLQQLQQEAAAAAVQGTVAAAPDADILKEQQEPPAAVEQPPGSAAQQPALPVPSTTTLSLQRLLHDASSTAQHVSHTLLPGLQQQLQHVQLKVAGQATSFAHADAAQLPVMDSQLLLQLNLLQQQLEALTEASQSISEDLAMAHEAATQQSTFLQNATGMADSSRVTAAGVEHDAAAKLIETQQQLAEHQSCLETYEHLLSALHAACCQASGAPDAAQVATGKGCAADAVMEELPLRDLSSSTPNMIGAPLTDNTASATEVETTAAAAAAVHQSYAANDGKDTVLKHLAAEVERLLAENARAERLQAELVAAKECNTALKRELDQAVAALGQAQTRAEAAADAAEDREQRECATARHRNHLSNLGVAMPAARHQSIGGRGRTSSGSMIGSSISGSEAGMQMPSGTKHSAAADLEGWAPAQRDQVSVLKVAVDSLKACPDSFTLPCWHLYCC
jgi:hypothetical protein